MSIRDMIPARRSVNLPARAHHTDVLTDFHREVDRLFDRVFGDMGFGSLVPFSATSLSSAWPRINLAESEKDIVVSAELPGVEEKDIKVEIDERTLVLRGELQHEQEEKGRQWTRVEREYGSFHREIPLPAEVEADKARAVFSRGVLTITLPRRTPAQSSRRTIDVKAA